MIGLALRRTLCGFVALIGATLLLLGGSALASAQGASSATPVVADPVATVSRVADDVNETTDATDAPMALTTLTTLTTDTVVVTLRNDTGSLVPGGCVALDGPTSVIACDGRDGDTADGITRLVAPAGEYALVVTEAPVGYLSGDMFTVFLNGRGQTIPADYTLVRGGSDVFVTTTDSDGATLRGACYRLVRSVGGGERGELVGIACDAGDGAARFPGIGPGGYLAVQTLAPGGLPLAEDTFFNVPFGGTGPISVPVENVPDVQTATLTVRTTDRADTALSGACYVVFVDAGNGARGAQIASRCDVADGLADGRTVFDALEPGDVVLAQTTAPTGYGTAADRRVTLVAGEAAVVTVTVEPGGSDVAVRTVEVTSRALLPGACFALHRDEAGAPTVDTLVTSRCDADGGASDGTTDFPGVAPGSYLLVQTTFPPQHTADVDTARVTVDGLADVTVTAENRPQTLVEQMVEVLIAILREILGA